MSSEKEPEVYINNKEFIEKWSHIDEIEKYKVRGFVNYFLLCNYYIIIMFNSNLIDID